MWIDRATARWMWRAAAFAIAAFVSALFLLPLFWAVAWSLRPVDSPPPTRMEWLPIPPAWSNYALVFDDAPMAQYALNSAIIVAVAVPLTLLVASWGGFAMSQLSPVWRRRFVFLSVGLMVIPISDLWLARFLVVKWLGLIDSRWSLILPALLGSSPLLVLLFYVAFRRIPSESLESAQLDGAGAMTVWARIAMPFNSATIMAVAVLAFLLYWGDFVGPVLYLKSQALYTLPIGLSLLQQLEKTRWSLVMAGSLMYLLPAVLAFLLVQRHFLSDRRLFALQAG